MLQSFSINNFPQNQKIKLTCHRCYQRPKSCFVILLCDHIICANCLDQYNQIQEKLYDGIKCTCGVITYKMIDKNRNIQDQNDYQQQLQIQNEEYNSGEDNYDNNDNNSNQDREYNQNNKYREQRITANRNNNKNNISVNIHHTNIHKQSQNKQKYRQNQQKSRQNSIRPSIGLIHSKNTTSTKNVSRINTQPTGFINNTQYYHQNNQRISNQKYSKSHHLNQQIRQKFMLQQSKYPVNSTNNKKIIHNQQKYRNNGYFGNITPVHTSKKIQNIENKTRINMKHHIPRFIDSQSIIQENSICKQNNNPNITNRQNLYRKQRKTDTQKYNPNNSQNLNQFIDQQQISAEKPKHINKLHNNNSYSPYRSQNNSKQKQQKNTLTSQLNSQIKYLKLTHKKNLQTLQRVYMKAKQKINQDYLKLQNNLKDICLEAIVLDRKDTHVNFNKIIKMRYQTCVGKNLQKLCQEIKKYGVSSPDFQIKYDQNRINQQYKSRQRKQRFTSPQPYSSAHLQTQPSTVYASKSSKFNPTSNYQNLISQTYNKHNNTCIHTPNSQNQPISKLQKKTAKRRTNIVIQL